MSNGAIIPGRLVLDPSWTAKTARALQTFVDNVSRVLSGKFVLTANGAYDIVTLEFVQGTTTLPLYFSAPSVTGPPVGVVALQCVSMPTPSATDYVPTIGWAYSNAKQQPYLSVVSALTAGQKYRLTLLVMGG